MMERIYPTEPRKLKTISTRQRYFKCICAYAFAGLAPDCLALRALISLHTHTHTHTHQRSDPMFDEPQTQMF
jgi:hypothetical protein